MKPSVTPSNDLCEHSKKKKPKTKQNKKINLTAHNGSSYVHRVRIKSCSTTSAQPCLVSSQRRIWCECSLTLPLQAVLKIAQPNQCILDFNCTSRYQIIFPLVFKEHVCCGCQLIFCVLVIKITEELCNSLYSCSL